MRADTLHTLARASRTLYPTCPVFVQPANGSVADDAELRREIEHNEGRIPYMYVDIAGYVTVGIGQKLATAADAQPLPFAVDGSRPITFASREAIAAAWRRVHARPGLGIAEYRAIGGLVLADVDIDALFRTRVRSFVADLSGTFHDFDTFPYPAQKALVDLAFNVGSVTSTNFPNLVRAARRRDWRTAAAESHRTAKVPNPARAFADRNEYTRQLFISAAAADTAKPRVGAP